MARLRNMPPIIIPPNELLPFGQAWAVNSSLTRTPPYSSLELTYIFDRKVGEALAEMLGNRVVPLTQNIANPTLIPENADTVEVGPCCVVGGVRSQNFDVGYRPDGIRIAFDSKTLNDTKSVKKNFLNMINDLGAESAFVHARFPYAVIAFIVAIPDPCITGPRREQLASTLQRLTGRKSPDDVYHKAEAIAFILWSPETGEINTTLPEADSPLRIENFSQQIEEAYVLRYANMPPHR